MQSFTATSGRIFGAPVFWSGADGPTLYIWGQNDHLLGYRFSGGLFGTPPALQSQVSAAGGLPGGILSLSANGASDGIVWANLQISPSGPGGMVRAFDARDLTNELWTSEQVSARDRPGAFAKFSAPTVANGTARRGK